MNIREGAREGRGGGASGMKGFRKRSECLCLRVRVHVRVPVQMDAMQLS